MLSARTIYGEIFDNGASAEAVPAVQSARGAADGYLLPATWRVRVLTGGQDPHPGPPEASHP